MKVLEKAKMQALKIFNNEWIEWRHIPTGISHCHVCLALDQCWFQYVEEIKMLKLPQHENCHCTVHKIVEPIPGKTAIAICPIEKFTEYIFAEKYAWNGKRQLFFDLGFDILDSEKMKAEFERQSEVKYASGKYVLGKLNKDGQRIDIKIELERQGKSSVSFISGWMIRKKGLITNNTPLGG